MSLTDESSAVSTNRSSGQVALVVSALLLLVGLGVAIACDLFVNNSTTHIPGSIIGGVGLGLVLLGTYRLLSNIQVITDAAQQSSGSSPL